MLELWNLMDTPVEEQQMFQNVTCNIAASEHEISEPNTLSVDFINSVSDNRRMIALDLNCSMALEFYISK